MTLMPLAVSNFPVIPPASQDGDHLQRIAVLHLFFFAIRRVSSAPATNAAVTSFPVTFLRSVLSAHVSYTCPPRRFTGGLGTGRPPMVSGHTGTTTDLGCSARYRRTNALYGTGFPCQRHETPNRHDEIKMFMRHKYHNRAH